MPTATLAAYTPPASPSRGLPAPVIFIVLGLLCALVDHLSRRVRAGFGR
jgi:hypothetical protein